MDDPKRHPLRALLVTQFLGAFNDNAWKLIVTLLAIQIATDGLSGTAEQAAAHTETSLAFIAFMLPMLLVSLPAGAVADRVSKRNVIIGTKALEVLLMAGATAILFVSPGHKVSSLAILALMGIQSGLFSPAKYGILPEILPHSRLSEGNGQLEMWTFLAIVGGTAAGGLFLEASGDAKWVAGALLFVLAVTGLASSFRIPKVPAARAEGGVVDTIRDGWSAVRGSREIWLSVLGLSLFWGVANLLGQNVLVYAKLALELDDSTVGLPMAAVGVGIGIGGVAAGKLSRGKVEMGLVPLGATGMALFASLLGVLTPGFWGTLFLMTALGTSSGLLLVPLNAIIQWKAPKDRRGSVIALSNVLQSFGMLAGTYAGGAFARIGMRVEDILITIAVVTILGTVWALWVLPQAFLRLLLVLLTNSFYRLNLTGADRLPTRGGVLLAPNHVSYMDGLFVIAATDRPVRFLVDAGIFKRGILRWGIDVMGGIPVSPKLGPEEINRALRAAGDAIDNGEVVCIFPEGQITRTGSMQGFRRGIERIANGRNGVIVPMHLDRVWGSVFSREQGRFFFKMPKRFPYPVTAAYGEPMSADSTANEVRRAVSNLGAEAWELRKADRTTLHRRAIRVLRRRPWAFQFGDISKPHVTRFKTLVGAIVLARKLAPHWQGQENVGVMMPSTVGGALVNVAASICGKTIVNLNYTIGEAGLLSAVRQAELRSVVSAKVFCAKANVRLPETTKDVWLEDVAETISAWDRVSSLLLAVFAPIRLIESVCGNRQPKSVNDRAAIIFSSGSTGEPKGIPLTHFNISANVEQVAQVFRPEKTDRMLGILPLFHSFGTLALWFSINREMPTAFQPNPLDAQAVGKIVSKYRVTLMLATPTLLSIYSRGCKATQFGSLRLVVAGAEKLTDKVRDAFQDRFGVRPFEGYGATECSPAIAVGTPDYRAPGFFQPGSRRGYIGQVVPGMAAQIVDPESRDVLGPDQEGLVLVRGPNVFDGYLDRPDLTDAAFHDGWYVTGDIGKLDRDSYLAITDRASRFAKIGGEMVPCCVVEAALHHAAGADGQTFAVTVLHDDRRGEKLAVVHTYEGDVDALIETARTDGLPNLFTPKARDFHRVEELPTLGTGKTDLRGVKSLAEEADS